jgi:hypothetical protein
MTPSEAPKLGSNVAAGKKEYHKPRLTTFGSVSKITRSGGSHLFPDSESMSRMPHMMPMD